MRTPLATTALLLLAALPAEGMGLVSTNAYFVGREQRIDQEQWIVAATAEIHGILEGDLFIASGGELLLDGSNQGDVWGAAGLGATLAGSCGRNVRLAGKTVRIEGSVAGNFMAMADTIIIGTNATIGGGVVLVGSSVVHEGVIEGDASISAARLATLGGRIGGKAKVVAPDIVFTQKAQLEGDLSYTAAKELFPAEGVVAGRLERVQPRREPLLSAARFTSRGIWFLAAFLAGVPFIALFPMTTAMAVQLVRRSPWKCLFAGMLASGALPIFGLMCASSLVGIPLGVLIIASWGILAYLSRIVAGLLLGTLVLHSTGMSIGRVLLAMGTGLALIYFTSAIPPLGLPIQLAVVWLGMGSLLLALLEKRRLIIQVPQNLKQLEELMDKQKKPTEEKP